MSAATFLAWSRKHCFVVAFVAACGYQAPLEWVVVAWLLAGDE